MSERVETHDFMSVDSFSQLPFIRPSPKPSPNGANIRLFGFELPPDNSAGSSKDGPSSDEDDPPSAAAAASAAAGSANAGAASGGGGGGESGRKFECHYCCRNFPTSQALGGHQNAHKRERQHAKRAHLQSTMAAAAHHHHHHPISEGHVYGILNYHRLGSSAAARFGIEPPPHYPSWSSNSPRYYSGLGSASQPINGSPLPAGLWRVPMVVHRDGRSAMPNSLGGGVESRLPPASLMAVGPGNYNASSSTSSSSAASHSHDGVSLDLHL